MVKEIIEQLKTLQQYDSRIAEIKAILNAIPEQIKESKDAFDSVVAVRDEAQAAYNEKKELFNKADVYVSGQQALLSSAQAKLSNVHNTKEYEAALRELDTLKKTIETETVTSLKLAEEMAALSSIIDEKTAESAEKEALYLAEKSEKEAANSEYFDELNKLEAVREEFAKGVKKAYLTKYERIRQGRNNLAVVPLEGVACTGCFMKLTPQLVVEIKREKELKECPTCQRFVYAPKVEEEAK